MPLLMANCFAWLKNRNKPGKDIKLVIIGLDDAGKTTTVACLQGEPPDGITPTVGFSNANLKFSKWNITLFDLGGGNNVRSVWKKYFAEIYGIIFTVDSSNTDRVEEAESVLKDIFSDPKVSGKPILVFANKQDKKGALGETVIKEKLKLETLADKYNFKYNVFPCSAIKGYGKQIDRSIKEGLNWLLTAVNEDFVTIHEKVEKESKIQKEEEAKERKERLERIRKLREEREKAAKEAGVEEEEENEEDDDVMGGPFRNINDQIKITEKREKKEKENMKKIKAYQEKKAIKMENEIDENNVKKTSKKKGKQKKVIYEKDDDIPEKDSPLKFPKINGSPDSGLSDTYEIDDDRKTKNVKKKKKKKKKKVVQDENDGIENDNELDSLNVKIKDKQFEDSYGEYDATEQNESNSSNKKKSKRTKQFENVEMNSTNIIVVNSSENVKESDGPSKERKKKKPKNHDIEDENESDINNKDTRTSQEKINDSRAEIFRARSSDALKVTDCKLKKSSKKKKGKKKKNNNDYGEGGNDEMMINTSNEELKRKKRKKKNRTEPNDDNDIPSKWNGKLPPIRENGHVSKLQPIELRGRLPDIGKGLSLQNGSV